MAITVAFFLSDVCIAGSVGKIIIGNQVSPTWNQTINNPSRFQLVLGGQGVLDKETGIVWEQSPSTSLLVLYDAQFYCNNLTKGSRMGWRLPTIQELASLMDPTASSGPMLPSGHPFLNVKTDNVYWSATVYADVPGVQWIADFNSNGVTHLANSNSYYSWCVRSGEGVNPQ